MTVAVSILPTQQLAALNDAYRKAIARAFGLRSRRCCSSRHSSSLRSAPK
jgi:hypothetical protein